jgi:hypothetical protein
MSVFKAVGRPTYARTVLRSAGQFGSRARRFAALGNLVLIALKLAVIVHGLGRNLCPKEVHLYQDGAGRQTFASSPRLNGR